MTKEEALEKLEDARDLITEAKYIIEEIIPQCNILGVKKMDFLEVVADLIKMLSELRSKGGSNPNLPIEGVYKLLYYDHKKVLKEKKELQKDILALMQEKEWDKDTASLNLKLMRSGRKIEQLTVKLESYKQIIDELKKKNYEQRKILKRNNILKGKQSASDGEVEDDE